MERGEYVKELFAVDGKGIPPSHIYPSEIFADKLKNDFLRL